MTVARKRHSFHTPLGDPDVIRRSRGDAYRDDFGITNWLDFRGRADLDFDIEADVRAPQRAEVLAAMNNRKPFGGPVPDGVIERVSAELDLHPFCVRMRLRELGYEVTGIPDMKARRPVPAHRAGLSGATGGARGPGRPPTRVAAVWDALAAGGAQTHREVAKRAGIRPCKAKECLCRLERVFFKRVSMPRRGEVLWDIINPANRPVAAPNGLGVAK